ncbi:translation initiation factor eIF-2B subunit gamma [Hyalella azteca]|uniref:Translation initiation factor eIF2B subunit gamma n=1 Tax=Hyalella azteca TaxID=294128 RepID=A0A8B7N9R8_HYAAZ|nr:translation initiation factor eIF-2B subunit gamma [Hyalella azteca]
MPSEITTVSAPDTNVPHAGSTEVDSCRRFKIRHNMGAIKSAQAVVLAAGSGSRMTTLVNNTPKCFLPIASIPMLYYPLYMLQSSGFEECIVVVDSSQVSAVSDMAQELGLTIKLRLFSDSEEDRGTLDSLRHIADAFEEDVEDMLIVSSDLVSDINMEDMLLTHRYQGAALTVLTTRLNKEAFTDVPGLKSRSNIGPDLVLESVTEKRLVGSVCGGDYDEHVTLPHHVTRLGAVTVAMDIVDAHAYVISGKLFREYILSDKFHKNHNVDLYFVQDLYMADFKYERAVSSILEPFASLALSRNRSAIQGRHSQCWPHSAGGRACYAYMYTEGVCVRANTIPAYWYLNTKIPAVLSVLCPECPVRVGDYSTSELQPKAVVKGNTLLGRGCRLSDRTTVADSCLGRNCSVAPGCRVTNSVLLDDVALEPGTILDGSIVSCTIDKEKCTIKKSIVASARTLHAESVVTGNTLEATQFFSA